MPQATLPFDVAPRHGWWEEWRGELASHPGRAAMTLRLVIGVVLVTLVSMTLEVPEVALSAYMIFFVTKASRKLTVLAGALLIVGVTVAIAASLLLYHFTFDFPPLRVVAMAGILFAGMFFSRVFVIGPLGLAVGFVTAMAQSNVDGAHTAELGVRSLLWLWVIVVYPIALTIVINQFFWPAASAPPATRPAAANKHLLVADAFTNPAHLHFALKVTLAAMACYLLYTALDWPGIHTSFITCCFIPLESSAASARKARLRLVGCAAGGLLGFLAILYLVPRMETIGSLLLLTAAVSAFAGWIAAGSDRIAYGGLQIAFAFYLALFQGFAPGTDFTVIRDRLVGIVLGILVLSITFRYVWPERSDQPEASPHAPR